MKQVILLVLIVVANHCYGQERRPNIIPYTLDANISDTNGKPIKPNGLELFAYPNTPYFPVGYFRDTIHWVYTIGKKPDEFNHYQNDVLHPDCGIVTLVQYATKNKVDINSIADTLQYNIDTSHLGWFSRDIFNLSEPVLYNYQIANEVIRLTILRSFEPPMTIRVNNQKGVYTLYFKELNKMVEYQMNYIINPGKPTQRDSIVTPDNSNIRLGLNKSKVITEQQFASITDAINSAQIQYEAHHKRTGCKYVIDGSEWILEIQNSNGYFYAHRSSPKGETINRIAKLMVKMAGYSGLIN